VFGAAVRADNQGVEAGVVAATAKPVVARPAPRMRLTRAGGSMRSARQRGSSASRSRSSVHGGDLVGQPPRQLHVVVLAKPAEPEQPADLSVVPLRRATRPVVAAQLRRVHRHLAGDIGHRGRRQFPGMPREPPFQLEELQGQG